MLRILFLFSMRGAALMAAMALWSCGGGAPQTPAEEPSAEAASATPAAAQPPLPELAAMSLAELEALAAERPEVPEIAMALGDALRRAARFEDALQVYAGVAQRQPGLPPARLGGILCQLQLGQYGAARRNLEGAVRAFPRQRRFFHLLARILAAAPEEALRDGARALELAQMLATFNVDARLAETCAMALAETGAFEQAVVWQQRAVNRAEDEAYKTRLLTVLQDYVDRKPCRQPWAADDPMFRAPLIAAPGDADLNAPWKAPGLAMKRRLSLIVQHADPEKNIYLNRRRALIYNAQLRDEQDLNRLLRGLPLLGAELLRGGRSLEAAQAFEQTEKLIRQYDVPFSGDSRAWLKHRIALSFLRLGEQENCLLNHTSDSCLLPIREGGVHQAPRGSRNAIRVYEEILREFPDDLKARWLLNLAYMTLGEHPDGVAPQWRIDPAVYRSERDFPRFLDAADAAGLAVDDLSGGSVVADFDNDGLLDVMASSWAIDGQLRAFRNRGDGGFDEITEQAGLKGLVSGLNLEITDYDNDGDVDVYVMRGAWLEDQGEWPNSLLRNNGDGTFTDVTEEAGLLTFHPTQTSIWFDYNNDGWLDLFIGNETTGETERPCQLYHNNGDGTFAETAQDVGAAVVGFVKGVTAGDFNNDGRTDLYLSCFDQPNVLLRNLGPRDGLPEGRWAFADVSRQAGVAEPLISFPTWFFDYDNDGWLDLFVSDYYNLDVDTAAADLMGLENDAERSRLYRNKGDGTFEDVTKRAGMHRVLVGMGANFGDINDDGWLDMYIGTGKPDLAMLIPNRMFLNEGGKRFADISAAGGFGHLQKGHGVSFADIDNDGDQDVHAVMGGAYEGDNYRNALFLNPGFGHSWLKLSLQGVKTNRAAVGARVNAIVRENGVRREIHRAVGSGGSFGASPFLVELGLGKADRVEAVEVFWPVTGETQRFEGLAINKRYRLVEGEAAAREEAVRVFEIKPGGGHGTHHH